MKIPVLLPNFAKGGGLVTVVAQDEKTGEVLMVAYANEQAYQLTLKTGEAHYWSRSDPSRQPWHKGATSGHVQRVLQVLVDCDGDALVYKVEPAGPACHTGHRSCFYRDAVAQPWVRGAPPEQLTAVEVEVTQSLLPDERSS